MPCHGHLTASQQGAREINSRKVRMLFVLFLATGSGANETTGRRGVDAEEPWDKMMNSTKQLSDLDPKLHLENAIFDVEIVVIEIEGMRMSYSPWQSIVRSQRTPTPNQALNLRVDLQRDARH